MRFNCQQFALPTVSRRRWRAVSTLALLAVLNTVPSVPLAGSENLQPEPVARPAAGEIWEAEAGLSLRHILEDWGRKDGWQVLWDSQSDIRIRSAANFSGSFEQAVLSIMKAIYPRHPQLQITLYLGNRVLHASMAP